MRAHLKGNLKAEEFLNLVLEIGNERLKEEAGKVHIRDNFYKVVKDLRILHDKLDPGLSDSNFKRSENVLLRW